MTKIVNLKLVILLEYRNIKTFLQKVKIIKNTVPWTYVISDLKGEESA